jgi:NTP pyrophosphatase (non-canonical NTP hydrolase)
VALPVRPGNEPSKAVHHRPNMGKLTPGGKHLYPTTGLPASLNLVPSPGEADMNIRSAQQRAWQNKIVKGFNTTDVPLEFCLLQGEIAEAFDAWRTGREDLGEELADVAIYLLSLAEMTGVDLQDEIEAKMAKNAARVYRPLPNGALTKSDGAAD